MKKSIIVAVVITILFSIALLAIPKHEVPTDKEWEEYLAWEQEYFEWIDNLPSDYYRYQVQHRDTHEVYHQDTLDNCKTFIATHEAELGECIIMPYTPLEK